MTGAGARDSPFDLLAIGIWLASGEEVGRLAGRACDPSAPSGPSGENPRDHLLSAALEEKMLPMVHAYARARRWADLDRLRASNEIFSAAGRALYDGIAPVLRALRSRGVDAMLIKGGALDLGVYDEDLPRTMDDLDLLVKPPDLDVVVAELEAAGFVQGRVDLERMQISPLSPEEKQRIAARHYELAPFSKLARVPALSPLREWIDPDLAGEQFRVVGGEVFMVLQYDVHFNLSLGFDVADVWEFHESGRLPDGTEVLIQAPSDLAWFLPARAYHEVMALGEPSLRQFVDWLALLAARGDAIDWDHVLRLANRYDLHPGLFYMLWHADELLPSTVPREVIEACSPDRPEVKRFHDWGDFVPKLLGTVSVTPLLE